MYSRYIGGIRGVWFVAGDWSVQSYRLAACLNVLRRVYSSYQFPGKYLHFRTPTCSPSVVLPLPFCIVPTVALRNCRFPKNETKSIHELTMVDIYRKRKKVLFFKRILYFFYRLIRAFFPSPASF